MVCLSPESVKKSGHGESLSCSKSEGQSLDALPWKLRFLLLRYGEGVIDIDTEISHGALNFSVSEQELNGS
jgi:hypothetical protein